MPGKSLSTFAAACALVLASVAQAETSTQAALEHLVDQLRDDGHLEIGAAQVAAAKLIPAVYQQRDYIPAWVSDASVEAVLEAIRNSYDHGLDPEDYHWQAISELRSRVAAGAGAAASSAAARTTCRAP